MALTKRARLLKASFHCFHGERALSLKMNSPLDTTENQDDEENAQKGTDNPSKHGPLATLSSRAGLIFPVARSDLQPSPRNDEVEPFNQHSYAL